LSEMTPLPEPWGLWHTETCIRANLSSYALTATKLDSRSIAKTLPSWCLRFPGLDNSILAIAKNLQQIDICQCLFELWTWYPRNCSLPNSMRLELQRMNSLNCSDKSVYAPLWTNVSTGPTRNWCLERKQKGHVSEKKGVREKQMGKMGYVRQI